MLINSHYSLISMAKQSIENLESLYGCIKYEITDDDLEKVREEVGREILKEHGLDE
jgi:hypothetical protein